MTTHPDSLFWDRMARRYAARPVSNMSAYEKTLAQTRAYLTATDTVLEVGCGTGSTALLLAPHVARYTASDISAEMVAIGREKTAEAGLANLSNVQGGLGDAELGTGPYDAVLAFNMLHLVRDPGAEARKAHAVLRPGGVFISKSACLSGYRRLLVPLVGLMRLVGKAPYVHAMSPAGLESQIRDAGFQIVEANNPSGSPMGHFIVARKV